MKDLLYKEVNEGDIIFDIDSHGTIGIVCGQTPIGRPRIVVPYPEHEYDEDDEEDYEGHYTGNISLVKSFVRNDFLKMTIEEAEEFLKNYNEENGFEFGEGGVDEFIQALKGLMTKEEEA